VSQKEAEGEQIADTEKGGDLNVGDQSSGDGTVRPSVRAWEAVSSLERRLGTTTGMGQTNRLALASRESPGIIHGYPRSFAIHQRRAYALVLQLCNSLTDALVAVREIERTLPEPAIPDQHQPCCFIAGTDDQFWQFVSSVTSRCCSRGEARVQVSRRVARVEVHRKSV